MTVLLQIGDTDVALDVKPGDVLTIRAMVGRVEADLIDVRAYGKGPEVLPGEVRATAVVFHVEKS